MGRGLAAEEQWRWWYDWATRSWLEPVVDVAQMLKRHLPNVLAYFRHWITNAMTEGVAGKIQRLRRTARPPSSARRALSPRRSLAGRSRWEGSLRSVFSGSG